jgi:hypothetical protein
MRLDQLFGGADNPYIFSTFGAADGKKVYDLSPDYSILQENVNKVR